MSNINFDNPWLLLLFLPLAAAVTVPFFWAVRRENANGHNVASLVLHLLICVCFTLAVSGMSYESVVTETNVYVVADLSYSADHNVSDVQRKLAQVADKLPENSKMGVVAFGRNHKIVSDMGGGVPDLSSVTGIDKSATDIGAAIRYAGNLFDDGVIKRIVVITDGAETVASNNIIKIVSSLQNDGVYIDAVYVDDNLTADVREVQIDGADVTPCTYVDKEEEARVLVRANVEGDNRIDGYAELYKDGVLTERKTASFYNGLNVVTFTLPTDTVGTFRYEARVRTADEGADRSPNNNRYLFTQRITNERKVLFIGGSEADTIAGRRIYGDVDTTYISNMAEIPLSVEELCVYDEIALSNFDVRALPSWSMFLASIDTLVNDYGKTLSTYGNTYLQENEGDSDALNALAGLLPVTVGNPDQDTRLFAFVLDISLSMNFESRLQVAKGAAIRLLEALNPTDMVMVVGFAGGVRVMLEPTYLRTVGVIVDAIERCEVENETNLSAALRHTHALMPKRFYDKRVVVISDGLNPESDNAAAKAEAVAMSKEDIAVSALTVYAKPAGISFFDALVRHADAVEGVFYTNIQHESEADVVIGDLRKETQEIEIEGDEYAVTVHADAYFTESDGLEPVRGFWYNSAKTKATAVLTAKYYRDHITAFDVPIYAYWYPGKGKVASFLSDITSEWTGAWGTDSGGAAFLAEIPDATLPNERIDVPFIVDVAGSGSSTAINVTASETLPDSADFTVTLTDPDGLVSTKALAMQSGVYFAVFSTDSPGTYTVLVEYKHGDLRYRTETEFSVSYYAEYDAFTGYNRSHLYRLLTENGQILELDSLQTLQNTDSEYTSYIFRFTVILMVLCAVLFVADIVIRQLKWKDVTSFFKGLFRRRRHEK